MQNRELELLIDKRSIEIVLLEPTQAVVLK